MALNRCINLPSFKDLDLAKTSKILTDLNPKKIVRSSKPRKTNGGATMLRPRRRENSKRNLKLRERGTWRLLKHWFKIRARKLIHRMERYHHFAVVGHKSTILTRSKKARKIFKCAQITVNFTKTRKDTLEH